MLWAVHCSADWPKPREALAAMETSGGQDVCLDPRCVELRWSQPLVVYWLHNHLRHPWQETWVLPASCVTVWTPPPRLRLPVSPLVVTTPSFPPPTRSGHLLYVAEPRVGFCCHSVGRAVLWVIFWDLGCTVQGSSSCRGAGATGLFWEELSSRKHCHFPAACGTSCEQASGSLRKATCLLLEV